MRDLSSRTADFLVGRDDRHIICGIMEKKPGNGVH